MKKIIFLIAVSQMLVMCIIFRKSTAEWKNLELYWNEKERENYYDSGTYIYFKLCTAFCSQCNAYYGGLPSCSACYSLERYFPTVFNSRLSVN